MTTAFAKPSKITDALYVGGYPVGKLREGDFDAIVFCAKEYQPPSHKFPGFDLVYAPLKDAELTPEAEQTAASAARAVCDLVQEGKRVLVTCALGINRSSLVAALALVCLYRMPGISAARLVQRSRPGSLSNADFLSYLESL